MNAAIPTNQAKIVRKALSAIFSLTVGAIQHRMPADSKWLHIASAVSLSLLEWLIKTFDATAQRPLQNAAILVALEFIV
jgi:hypothetical protein